MVYKVMLKIANVCVFGTLKFFIQWCLECVGILFDVFLSWEFHFLGLLWDVDEFSVVQSPVMSWMLPFKQNNINLHHPHLLPYIGFSPSSETFKADLFISVWILAKVYNKYLTMLFLVITVSLK